MVHVESSSALGKNLHAIDTFGEDLLEEKLFRGNSLS